MTNTNTKEQNEAIDEMLKQIGNGEHPPVTEETVRWHQDQREVETRHNLKNYMEQKIQEVMQTIPRDPQARFEYSKKVREIMERLNELDTNNVLGRYTDKPKKRSFWNRIMELIGWN